MAKIKVHQKFSKQTWKEIPVSDYIEAALSETTRDGELESAREEITNLKKSLGLLVEILVDKEILSVSDIAKLVGVFRWNIVKSED